LSDEHRAAGNKARSIPLHQALPALVRDPLNTLVGIANQAGGEVVRLNLGTFHPYLVTDPSHVQHVLRDNATNFVRDRGMFWRPLKRLFGEGILAEGQAWELSRSIVQPMFTAKRLESIVDNMADAVDEAVDELEEPARAGQIVDVGAELSRIVCRAIMRVLFADKISVPDALRMVSAQTTIATAVLSRMLVPFMPNAVPMPGDRAFRRAARTIDDVILPVVRAAREMPDEGDDVISTLSRARDAEGRQLDERRVRNDAVAMFAGSTETTFGVLTWLWPLLEAHPAVADRLYEEIGRVVGNERVNRSHLSELTYTRMVLDEVLRLYPVAWLSPRVAVEADVIGGVRVPRGADILFSPYITQRMEMVWDQPAVFDPDRFAPRRAERHHRYAHFPFGGGPHQCLGQHLFYLESLVIVATIVSRFRFRLTDPAMPVPRVGAVLQPSKNVEVTLLPLRLRPSVVS